VARLLLEDTTIKTGLSHDRPFIFSKDISNLAPEEFSQYLRRKIDNEPVGGTSMRKLIYLHPNRDFAAYLLRRLHRLTDELIRNTVRSETQDRIAYLQKAIDNTGNPDHKRALTNLLMEQERIKMLVSIDQPYSARVIEPPAAGIKPHWPDKFIIFPGFLFIGLFFGFLVHGLRKT
jgi:hypothetical protein